MHRRRSAWCRLRSPSTSRRRQRRPARAWPPRRSSPWRSRTTKFRRTGRACAFTSRTCSIMVRRRRPSPASTSSFVDRVDRHVRNAGDRPHRRALAEHREDLDALGEGQLVHELLCLSSSIIYHLRAGFPRRAGDAIRIAGDRSMRGATGGICTPDLHSYQEPALLLSYGRHAKESTTARPLFQPRKRGRAFFFRQRVR